MKQLKKFSDDITQLGKELSRRSEKGETVPRVNFPEGISDADDSDDFIFGLPQEGQVPGGGRTSSSASSSDDDVSPDLSAILGGGDSSGSGEEEFDIEALLAEARGESPKPAAPASPVDSIPDIPGVPSGSGTTVADDAGSIIPDFSADNPFSIPGLDGTGADDGSGIPDIDALLSGFADDVDQPSFDVNSTSGAEPSAEELLGNFDSADFSAGNDFSADTFTPDTDFSAETPDDFAVQPDDSNFDNLFSGIELPGMGNDTADGSAVDSVDTVPTDIPDVGASDFDIPDIGDFSDVPAGQPDIDDFSIPSDSTDPLASMEPAGSADSPADAGGDFNFDMPDFDMPDFNSPASDVASAGAGETSADSSASAGDDFNFDIPDFSASNAGGAEPSFDMPSADIPSAGSGADDASDFDLSPADDGDMDYSSVSDDDLFATPVSYSSGGGGLSLAVDGEPESGTFELPPMDDDFPSFGDSSFSSADSTSGDAEADSGSDFSMGSSDSGDADPFATPDDFSFGGGDFGTGDFGNPSAADAGAGSSAGAADDFSFDLPEAPDFGDMSGVSSDTSAAGDSGSFESIDGDGDFTIPGFSDEYSDFDLVPPEPIEKKVSKTVTQEDKGGKKRRHKKEERERSELTEEEYQIFRQNLDVYPLNLRIALQEIIVNPDFTDSVVLKVIDMVIEKTPARTLANYLEKESLVEHSISVPSNFEKRTVAEYEEYRKSAEYRLKNRIIPAVLVTVIAGLFFALLTFLITKFVVKPVKAEMLYKEGYALIQNGLYPQSEVKFNEACWYKPKKGWFYEYARAYSEHKQYERAGNMYENLIKRYNYEKKAGLEYARMELEELSDYSKAEEITRRYVLDRHINDADGMLLLGDIYLEWATNSDSSKFEDARSAYADLMSVHGQNNLYLSRMMRYFIRTDQIREVLPLKSYFYPRLDRNPLEGQDLVELSGYLLDKLFGYLAPADEYLRTSIEDVRDLLERAVKKAPEIPESTYNLGRYFVETGNTEAAEAVLEESLGRFSAAEKQTHSRILKNINAYRLIGEIKADNQEYLDAEQMYVSGIDLFNSEQKRSGLKSDENVGILYSDLADLDYFISGDLDTALQNYTLAVQNHNDTASIRYKMGYISYVNNNSKDALNYFLMTNEDQPSERNTLFALGNTLVMRDSTSAAQGYYEKLIDILDRERETEGILYPQVQEEQGSLVELYMKTANNLGVTLYRLAKRNYNSSLNARAQSLLAESNRAWDALTRNQTTMIRLEGSNLASQNLKYMTVSSSSFEPEIYTSIPRVLSGEKVLSQPEAAQTGRK